MARAEIAPDGDTSPDRAPELSELDGEVTQFLLPANRKAPTAARALLALRFGRLLDARVLADAQLLVSELVTNSLLHGALRERDTVIVRMQLHAESLRLEVHNRGVTGTISSNGANAENGGGFGLDIVRLLSIRWGIRRGEDTCVWAHVATA